MGDAFLQSVNGAAFRFGNDKLLNQAGQFLEVPLRLLGPLLLGLAILAMRGRVPGDLPCRNSRPHRRPTKRTAVECIARAGRGPFHEVVQRL